eukprot:2112312-Prorocentrum_lima.AAC.1
MKKYVGKGALGRQRLTSRSAAVRVGDALPMLHHLQQAPNLRLHQRKPWSPSQEECRHGGDGQTWARGRGRPDSP